MSKFYYVIDPSKPVMEEDESGRIAFTENFRHVETFPTREEADLHRITLLEEKIESMEVALPNLKRLVKGLKEGTAVELSVDNEAIHYRGPGTSVTLSRARIDKLRVHCNAIRVAMVGGDRSMILSVPDADQAVELLKKHGYNYDDSKSHIGLSMENW